MILQHNYFTYMEPRWRVLNLFTRFWKCQDSPNIRCVPDLRLAVTRRGRFRPCHGIVNLGREDLGLDDIARIISLAPEHTARIVLERNSQNVRDVRTIVDLGKGIRRLIPDARLMIIAKYSWETLYSDLPEVHTVYLNYEPWRTDLFFWQNIKRMWKDRRITNRSYARFANKAIKEEMYENRDIMYETDFI